MVAARGAGQITLVSCPSWTSILKANPYMFVVEHRSAMSDVFKNCPGFHAGKYQCPRYEDSMNYPNTTNLRFLIGPLVLIAFIYEGIGIIIAWFIKQFFWIPHRFRYGILVAGGWGNYADIRMSHITPHYGYKNLPLMRISYFQLHRS